MRDRDRVVMSYGGSIRLQVAVSASERTHTRSHRINQAFPNLSFVLNLGTLILLAPLWPVLAIACAVFLYARHTRLVEPGRRVPLLVYILSAGICGAGFGVVGIFGGIHWACAGPNAGNLCGLGGFLVTGPLAGSVGVVLIAVALLFVRPQPHSPTRGGE